jgi:hypothetical protein
MSERMNFQLELIEGKTTTLEEELDELLLKFIANMKPRKK